MDHSFDTKLNKFYFARPTIDALVHSPGRISSTESELLCRLVPPDDKVEAG